jgi:hypothetical protein
MREDRPGPNGKQIEAEFFLRFALARLSQGAEIARHIVRMLRNFSASRWPVCTAPAIMMASPAWRARSAAAVLASYADNAMGRPSVVSAGLAVYFPSSGSVFQADPLHTAYRNGLPAAEYPVQFVDDQRWDEFLNAYTAAFP